MANKDKNSSDSNLTRQHHQMASGNLAEVARKNGVPAPGNYSKGAKVAPKRGRG